MCSLVGHMKGFAVALEKNTDVLWDLRPFFFLINLCLVSEAAVFLPFKRFHFTSSRTEGKASREGKKQCLKGTRLSLLHIWNGKKFLKFTEGSHSALLGKGMRWCHCQLYYTRLWTLGSTHLHTKHQTSLQKKKNNHKKTELLSLFIEGISKRETRWDTYRIKHLFGMSCRQTESGSGLDDWCCREAHNHNTNVPL